MVTFFFRTLFWITILVVFSCLQDRSKSLISTIIKLKRRWTNASLGKYLPSLKISTRVSPYYDNVCIHTFVAWVKTRYYFENWHFLQKFRVMYLLLFSVWCLYSYHFFLIFFFVLCILTDEELKLLRQSSSRTLNSISEVYCKEEFSAFN